jgi:hypothetical protein
MVIPKRYFHAALIILLLLVAIAWFLCKHRVSQQHHHWHESILRSINDGKQSRTRERCFYALPTFDPEVWNAPDVQTFNNCHAYAFRDARANRTQKPQPGQKAGLPELEGSEYTCENFLRYLALDHPEFDARFSNDPYASCRCGQHKVFLALDTRPGHEDFHWFRQDRDGTFSHKPGNKPASNLDADGNRILNPLTANRNFGNYNYSTPCGFLCVRGALRAPLNPFGGTDAG